MGARFNPDRPPRLFSNPGHVPPEFLREVEEAIPRTIAAGARPPLVFVGIGMTGIVFTDRTKNLAFKVSRNQAESMLAEEAEWFRAAKKAPFTGQHVPKGVRWDAANGVLIKTFVRGRQGSWGESSRLRDIHAKIEKDMLPRGWTAPEFKEDSYVVNQPDSTWYKEADLSKAVLVDASMPQRVGKVLVKHALDVAAGRKQPDPGERLRDLAYFVYRERIDKNNPRGTIPFEEVRETLAKLRAAGGEFDWTVD